MIHLSFGSAVRFAHRSSQIGRATGGGRTSSGRAYWRRPNPDGDGVALAQTTRAVGQHRARGAARLGGGGGSDAVARVVIACAFLVRVAIVVRQPGSGLVTRPTHWNFEKKKTNADSVLNFKLHFFTSYNLDDCMF